MIRIDEIYYNTFWHWIKKNLPLTRLFFCDPPGRSDPESLFNYGADTSELHYILLHDQEPIHLGLHLPLFDDAERRNLDLNFSKGPTKKAFISSEYNSESVDSIVDHFGFKHFYYFYHGWASLDWYRGYDKTYLIIPPEQRNIQKSFISPNRIIGGKRDHRLLLMYYLLKKEVKNAWISFPKVCPAENQRVDEIAAKYLAKFPNIVDTFQQANLPWDFPNETGHPMHSCWLSLFDESAESLAYVVTETVFYGRKNHLTEKTFKPICMQMPFVLVGTAHSLKYLRQYGFKTFSSIWDESYDDEEDDDIRLEKISNLLIELDQMSAEQLNELYKKALPIVKYNYEHFYNGDFEKILWSELQQMFNDMRSYWGEYANTSI